MKRIPLLILYTILSFLAFIWAINNENALFWVICAILTILTINLFYNRDKNPIDLTTAVTIVLTIVLIEISVPLLHPRVEVTNVNNPDALVINENGTWAYRMFTFEITDPLISFFNTSTFYPLGNKIYYVNTNMNKFYNTGYYTVLWYNKGTSNSIIFQNVPHITGFNKEISSIEIATDFPLYNSISQSNITGFYPLNWSNFNYGFCNSYGPVMSISNSENETLYFEKNLNFFIPDNATIYTNNGYHELLKDYYNSKGCFWLSKTCTLNWSGNVYIAIVNKTNNGFELTIPYPYSSTTLNQYESTTYYIKYYPNCG